MSLTKNTETAAIQKLCIINNAAKEKINNKREKISVVNKTLSETLYLLKVVKCRDF